MSTVIRHPELFAIAARLRQFAAHHHLSAARLLVGCKAAKRELAESRSAEVACWAGEKVMGAPKHHHTTEGLLA